MLKILWRRLHELQGQTLTRDQLLLKLTLPSQPLPRIHAHSAHAA
jgi:hypothetical protein